MKRISQNYMAQLKKAAHWRLAPKEAQTMLDDYEEILSHCAYPESDLSKEIGTPWQAARQMTEPGHYRRWLAVFTVLTACAFLPAISPAGPAFYLWELFTMRRSSFLLLLLFLLGQLLSFFWFQRTGVRRKESGLPKGLPLLLLLLLIGFLAAWAALLLMLLHSQKLACITEALENSALVYPPYPGQIISLALKCIGFFCAIFSGYALVQARLADRRWRAAYALGLTVTVLCIVILAVVTSMSFPFDWQKHCLQSCLFLTFAGLAGTGVSLC